MFQYHQPNIDNMQQYLKQENERSSGDGPTWWSIPAGMSSVRILPPWDPSGRVALPVYMHPIEYKGEGMSYTKYNWTCVNKTFGKPCPICEGLASMSASGVDVSNWEANRRQYYFNAIVMHDPTYNNKDKGTAPGTHVLLKAPKTFYDWIIAQITNPMVGDITSVTNGIDVFITKEGSGLGTTYNMTFSPNGRTAIPQEYLEKITNLYDLDSIFGAGFDQAQIDELVGHLKKSAGVMSNTVGNTVNQMAGYTQAPIQNNPPAGTAPWTAPSAPWSSQTTGYPPVNNPTTGGAPSNPYMSNSPQNNVAPSPFGSTAVSTNPAPPAYLGNQAPAQAQVPVSPAPVASAPANNQSNLPKCFGQYDAGNVNCVVCPHEINCSQSK